MSEEQSEFGPKPEQVFQPPTKPDNLFKALAKAQGEFKPIPKDSEVEVRNKEGKFLYSFKYADLTTIIDCTRPALAKHGLSFTQDYSKTSIGTGISTTIFHESGASIQTGFVPCQIQSQNMKEVAGMFTYAKRISLTAALGVSADEDVDAGAIDAAQGNSTQKQKTTTPPQKKKVDAKPVQPKPNKPNSPLEDLLQAVKERKIKPDLMPEIIKRCTGESLKAKDLTDEQVSLVMKYITKFQKGEGL